MVQRPPGGQFFFHFATDLLQFCQGDRIPRQARELILKGRGPIHVAGEQDFMNRAIVPGERTDETLGELCCESSAREETDNGEEVARSLAQSFAVAGNGPDNSVLKIFRASLTIRCVSSGGAGPRKT